MRATQRSTASGKLDICRACRFHVTRQSDLSTGHLHKNVLSTYADEVGGLAHDAGNLLGALRLYSDLLSMPGVLSDEYRDYAAELRFLSERSNSLIDRLVTQSQSQSSLEMHTEVTILPEIVDRCRGLLGKVAGRKIQTTYGAGAFLPVCVSEEAVGRILTNLVKNSAQATPRDGVISVNIEGKNDDCDFHAKGERRIVMTVSDSGCGISKDALAKLRRSGFTPWTGGRGLGIRIVNELVAMSRGNFRIDSHLGVGTRVSIDWGAWSHSVRVGTTP